MDCKTGQIHRFNDKDELLKAEKRLGRQLAPLSEEQAKKLEPLGAPRRKNWMRNQPCPCGSNKKFKKCCWSKYA